VIPVVLVGAVGVAVLVGAPAGLVLHPAHCLVVGGECLQGTESRNSISTSQQGQS
jgi:hypothetical protein